MGYWAAGVQLWVVSTTPSVAKRFKSNRCPENRLDTKTRELEYSLLKVQIVEEHLHLRHNTRYWKNGQTNSITKFIRQRMKISNADLPSVYAPISSLRVM